MKRNIKTIFTLAVAAAITIFVVSPALPQDKPADNMQILLEKIRAGTIWFCRGPKSPKSRSEAMQKPAPSDQ